MPLRTQAGYYATPRTEIEKSKPKRGMRQRSFAIDFVSPMQLEECLHRIQHLSQTNSLRIGVDDSEADIAVFKADLFDDERILVRYHGKMQRWEGTNTRITGEATIVGDVSQPVLWAILFVLMILICGAAERISETLIINHRDGRVGVLTILLFFTIIVPLVILTYASLRHISVMLNERQVRQTLKDILTDTRNAKPD